MTARFDADEASNIDLGDSGSYGERDTYIEPSGGGYPVSSGLSDDTRNEYSVLEPEVNIRCT